MNKKLLNELNPNTLRSYIEKAKPQVGTFNRASQQAYERANKQWDVKTNVRLALGYAAKSKRRAKGIEQAKAELREDLRLALSEAKKSKSNLGKPVQHNRLKGIQRGATVGMEGLRGMWASARHAATGVNMMRKHATKGLEVSKVVRKHPLKSIALAAAIGIGAGVAGSKVYDAATSMPKMRGVPSGKSTAGDFTTNPTLQWKNKNLQEELKQSLGNKLNQRMI